MYTKTQDNSYIVSGYVAKDAEMRKTKNGKSYATWSVKAGEKQDGEAVWVNCKAWGSAARAAASISKGDTVLAVGRLEESEYNGITYRTLVCEFVAVMPGSKPESTPPARSAPGFEPPPPVQHEAPPPDDYFPF